MHILISNDDGIFAPGIRALALAAARAGHRVTLFAPDEQRSAAGHAITLTRPLYARPVDYAEGLRAYSVDGTPADCVRLGLYLLKDDPADYVLSGINCGANRGAAALYSGTVSAAMEAALCGVPALAVSLCEQAESGYETAARLGVEVMEWSLKHPLPLGEIYSLNVPFGERVRGVRAAGVSHEYIFPPVYDRMPDGGCLFRREPDGVDEQNMNSDLRVTEAGWASLSILTWNLLANTPMPALDGLQIAAAEARV